MARHSGRLTEASNPICRAAFVTAILKLTIRSARDTERARRTACTTDKMLGARPPRRASACRGSKAAPGQEPEGRIVFAAVTRGAFRVYW